MSALLLDAAFEGHAVRVVGTPEDPHFVAQDVCDALGIKEARSTLRNFLPAQKGVHVVHTPGGEQEMLTVSEPGLYRLIFKSTRPEAERFQSWVFSDVLPAIRKSGSYAVQAKPEAPALPASPMTVDMVMAICTQIKAQEVAAAEQARILTAHEEHFHQIADERTKSEERIRALEGQVREVRNATRRDGEMTAAQVGARYNWRTKKSNAPHHKAVLAAARMNNFEARGLLRKVLQSVDGRLVEVNLFSPEGVVEFAQINAARGADASFSVGGSGCTFTVVRGMDGGE